MKKLVSMVLILCLMVVGCTASSQETAVIPEAEPAAAETVPAAQPEEQTGTETADAVQTIYPLPDTTMNELQDAILAVGFDAEDAYMDDEGTLKMDLRIYTYDKFEMADISKLQVGDILVRQSGEMEITSIERGEDGSVIINGGIDADGIWLFNDDSGIFYETEYNDSKNWYQVGEVTLPVSADFELLDSSDLELGEVVFYAGSFLTDEITYYDFTPNNTTVRVEAGEIVSMERVYTP